MNSTSLKHYVPQKIASGNYLTQILLVGAGGTGSQLITGLARINQALKALGHAGIHVEVVDGDTVSESNVGRQLFSRADVGRNKAIVLTTRMNMFFGTFWRAHPYHLIGKSFKRARSADIIISAVDNVETRVEIGQMSRAYVKGYWLDTGNTTNTGQVILGTTNKLEQPEKGSPKYLPNVLDLYGKIITKEAGKSYQGPNCSVADALARQDLLINQWVATCALEILWHMFRYGYVTAHGAFINLNPITVRSLPVDPVLWQSMGWKPNEGKKPQLQQHKKAA